MKIKICGMTVQENIYELAQVQPDFMGFIFYEKSKRCADLRQIKELKPLPKSIVKTGVFVNHDLQELFKILDELQLNAVQLHGYETVEYVKTIKEKIVVIKTFHIDDVFDWNSMKPYAPYVDYFLLENACKNFGGSGKHFNWDLLSHYQIDKPFLLSGGIWIKDVAAIKKINHPQLLGVDINSQFEIRPGIKNIASIQTFIKLLKE